MPKDNRQIVRGVRVGGKLYKTDMEDELQEVMSQKDLDRLIADGSIVGDFKSKMKASAKSADAGDQSGQPADTGNSKDTKSGKTEKTANTEKKD